MRQPTDEWLARTLHDNIHAGDQGDILEALANATSIRVSHGRPWSTHCAPRRRSRTLRTYDRWIRHGLR
jgi:hypothetical protein